MTILPAGTFRVRDYRKAIPTWVKLQVIIDKMVANPQWVDARELEFDHDPALVNRTYDTEAGDFIPPQNDPSAIVARRNVDHDEKTFGRKAGAEKTVTTRGSDVGEAARIRNIRASEAIHQAQQESKAGNYAKAAAILAAARVPKRKTNKRKIPSRPFQSVKRSIPSRGFGRG